MSSDTLQASKTIGVWLNWYSRWPLPTQCVSTLQVRILLLQPMISLDTLNIIADALRHNDAVRLISEGKIERYEDRYFTIEKNAEGKVVFKSKPFPTIFTYAVVV